MIIMMMMMTMLMVMMITMIIDNDGDEDKDKKDEFRHNLKEYNTNPKKVENLLDLTFINILPNFIQKSSKEKLNSKSSITCPKLPSVVVYKNKTLVVV